MLRPGLSDHHKGEALRLIKEVLHSITEMGQVTSVDYKVDGRYVNLIIELGKLKQELQNANGNGRGNP